MDKSITILIGISLFSMFMFMPTLLFATFAETQKVLTKDFIRSIQEDEIKNNLILVHNDTIPNYGKLTESQIKEALIHLPGWTILNGKLHKPFTFVDFPTLFDFMFKVSNTSQILNHHPNMSSTFNTLTLDYDMWSLGHAISNMNIKAARIIENLFDSSNHIKGKM
jgi:4a-hydroxytetrahydrobiopterin dehydratase